MSDWHTHTGDDYAMYPRIEDEMRTLIRSWRAGEPVCDGQLGTHFLTTGQATAKCGTCWGCRREALLASIDP